MRTINRYHQYKDQAVKVLWITFFWTVVSVMQFLLTYASVIQLELDLQTLEPLEYFTGSIITGIIAGIFGGSTMVFFWEKWLRTMSYKWSLVNIFWSYTVIYFLVAAIGGLFFQSAISKMPFYHPLVIEEFLTQYWGVSQLISFIFWLMVVILTLIALLVNDKYGPGVFVSFLMGKYFQPQREERIFMFLDLRSSTQIAEKLGERRYFNFLKELYRDVTPAILRAKGEIYQYVGDEIVISWKLEQGQVPNRVINCYFDIAEVLSKNLPYYQETYDGVAPEFKAGMHAGHAMVGEIGIVKREIAYSGDVLNTTARIQSKCNELGVNLLLSSYLLDKFRSLPAEFHTKALGAMELRGKRRAVQLYTVQLDHSAYSGDKNP